MKSEVSSRTPAAATTVMLFDGHCGFCDASVRFYLAHERDDRCRFVAIQSEEGHALASDCGLDPDSPSTFLFIDGGVAHERSAGVIAMASHLRWPWRLLALWRIVPKAWRDRQYDFVARNRYRIAGRKEACSVPSPELRARFMLPS